MTEVIDSQKFVVKFAKYHNLQKFCPMKLCHGMCECSTYVFMHARMVHTYKHTCIDTLHSSDYKETNLEDFKPSNVKDTNEGVLPLPCVQSNVDPGHQPAEHPLVQSLREGTH